MEERKAPPPKTPHLLPSIITTNTSTTTTAAHIPRDVWLVLLSFVEVVEVSSCKRVSKQWKEWMERLFNHSYDNHFPLVWNCEKGHIEEVERLLHILPTPPSNDNGDGYLHFGKRRN